MQSFFRLFVCLVIVFVRWNSSSHAQDVQGDIFVEATVDNAAPYVGQQIIYTFKLYDAVGTTNPLYQPSDFDGFWRVDIGVVSQVTEQINGRTYTVTTIATALYPTQPGEVSIQPASVVLPETVFRTETRLTASSVPLMVQPLPEGQPTVFSGGVGTFELTASLDRQNVPVGEPITMMFVLSGTGNVEQLPPPFVAADWRTSITAGAYSSEMRNGMVVGKRAYTILFYPSFNGKQILPSITLNYFDPISSIYRSASTPLVEIDVIGEPANVDSQVNDATGNSLELKQIKSLLSLYQGINLGVFLILMMLPVIGIAGAVGWKRFQIRRNALHIEYKKRQALRHALEQIDALNASDIQSAYEQLRRILHAYAADKLGVDAIKLKNLDIPSVMLANKVSIEVSIIMHGLLMEVEERLFAPTVQAYSASHIQDIKKSLINLDQSWEQN